MKSSSTTKKAFTLLEMLLALSIFSLLIFVFLEILLFTTKNMTSSTVEDTGEEYIIDVFEEEFQWAETIYLISPEQTKLRKKHFNFILFYRPSRTGEYRYVTYYLNQGNLRRWAENYNSESIERVLKQIDSSGDIIIREVESMENTGFLEGEKAFRIAIEMKDGKKFERIIDLSLKSFEDLREVEE